jgi:CubicO group peptidase (beta-lactamase class C family)
MKIKLIYMTLLCTLSCSGLAVAQNTHQANLIWLGKAKDAEKNIVVLHNENAAIPLQELQNLKAVSVNLGAGYSTIFNHTLNQYATIDSLGNYPGQVDYAILADDLKLHHTVILQLGPATVFDQKLLEFVLELEAHRRVVLVITDPKDHTSFFKTINSPLIWLAQKETDASAAVSAALIFGGVATAQPALRIKYTVPEELGINSANLDSIKIVMQEAIAAKAAPGGVVMVLKDGKVIYNEAFGKHTYTGNRAMLSTDIFDMASLTKISATTLEVMRLVEQGKLSLDSSISQYISRTKNNLAIKNIRVREVLLHEAGFVPFITFYKQLKPGDMSTIKSAKYPTEVADNYFIRKNYFREVMWPQMLADKALTRGQYIYSDLSMYFMKEIVEKVAREKLNDYVDENFYFPLGMQTAGFLPRNRFPKDRIVPTTENDGWFRDMTVQGFVDDPGAAMAGGVSGHAGFFASANDLAILYQMLLNKGTYGGQRYFKAGTVTMFTSGQSKVSRRGLGFDRKDPDLSKGYPSFLATPQVFGHTGYTGTAVWVDPAYNLVYIFLSNRVYPDDQNKELLKLNIRGRIQDIIYRAILSAKP